MDILLLTLKDTKHPKAGGVELSHHEIMKRLSEKGHNIIQFTSSFKGAKKREVKDGVKIFRSGNKYTVHLKGRKFYKKRNLDFDLVIDEWNIRPFNASDYTEEPTLLLFHMLLDGFWDNLLPCPASYVVKNFVEKRWLWKNRETFTITFSESTVQTLKKFGFKGVSKIPLGNDIERSLKERKNDKKTVLFLGRLSDRKGAEDALKAFRISKGKFQGKVKMEVAGKGPLLSDLKKKYSSDYITFHGYVSETKKEELLEKSDLALIPSKRENWCLVVTEANSKGTPVVGYDIPGLRDSIKHGETGILVDPDPISLSKGILKLLRDESLLKKILQKSS